MVYQLLGKKIPYGAYTCDTFIAALREIKGKNHSPMTGNMLAMQILNTNRIKRQNLIYTLFSNDFSTVDGIAVYDNSIKIIPNCQNFIDISTMSGEIKPAAYKLALNVYKKINLPEFQLDNLILDAPLTKKQAKENPIWHELLGQNKAVKFINLIFDELEIINNNEGMAVYILTGESKQVPTLYPVRVTSLKKGFNLGLGSLGEETRLLSMKKS